MRPGDTHFLLLLWHRISRVSNRLLFIYDIGIYTAEGTSLLWRGKQHLSLSTIYPFYLDHFWHHFMYTKHLYLLFKLLTLLRTTSLNTEQPRIRNDFINQHYGATHSIGRRRTTSSTSMTPGEDWATHAYQRKKGFLSCLPISARNGISP